MKQHLKFLLSIYKTHQRSRYYTYSSNKYNSAKAITFNNHLQQLFIPLLPLLFWFLCFSTIDPFNTHKKLNPHFETSFNDQPLAFTAPLAPPAIMPLQTDVKPIDKKPAWRTEIIRPGDTLADIFIKNQLSPRQLQEILNLKDSSYKYKGLLFEAHKTRTTATQKFEWDYNRVDLTEHLKLR